MLPELQIMFFRRVDERKVENIVYFAMGSVIFTHCCA